MIKLYRWIAALGVSCADDFGGLTSTLMTLVSVNKVAMPLVCKRAGIRGTTSVNVVERNSKDWLFN